MPPELGPPRRLTTATGASDAGWVAGWGKNEGGELGLGDTESRGDEAGEMGDALPAVPLGTGRTPVSVHMGTPGWGTGVGGRVCSILDDGTLKCAYGSNERGTFYLTDLGAAACKDHVPSWLKEHLVERNNV